MHRLTVALLAVAVLALASCGGSDADDTGAPGEVEFRLSERNDSNSTGVRVVLRYEDEKRTLVRIDGLDEGEPSGGGANPARLVKGSCDEPGAVAFELEPLKGPLSETTVDVGLPELFAGEYAIEVLLTADQPRQIACGEVPDDAP
ncbi:MAG TPA: hypothetical protein VJ689_11710 [Gaiellaceae bacterium]|jgi:hypothetical protein|nr:hypothetical protein [Gaiellaceae bacterium]